MHGLLDPAAVEKLPAVRAWLTHAETTRRIMAENYQHLAGDELLTATIEENVLVQLENLRTLPAVAARLAKGDLHVHGWVYKIETGEVFAYDPAGRPVRAARRTQGPRRVDPRAARTGHLIVLWRAAGFIPAV